MSKVTLFASLLVVAMSVAANADLRREGTQNYFYYFGTSCPRVAPCEAPCPPVTCEPSCMPVCCPAIRGILF